MSLSLALIHRHLIQEGLVKTAKSLCIESGEKGLGAAGESLKFDLASLVKSHEGKSGTSSGSSSSAAAASSSKKATSVEKSRRRGSSVDSSSSESSSDSSSSSSSSSSDEEIVEKKKSSSSKKAAEKSTKAAPVAPPPAITSIAGSKRPRSRSNSVISETASSSKSKTATTASAAAVATSSSKSSTTALAAREKVAAPVLESNSAAKAGEGAPPGEVDRRPFRRVHADDEWHKIEGTRLADNTYVGTFGNEGWGAKANDILSKVRGKDFRHEKTKKKRGSYRGGAIDTNAASASIRFADDE